MSDHNKNHIRVNIRPIFLSTLGTWNSQDRIYSKTLPSDALAACTQTCDMLFGADPASPKDNQTADKEICNQFCRKLSSQYVDDSEALIAVKKICGGGDIECLQANKSKINKAIDNLCKDDEPCLINNKDIFSMIYQNSSIKSKDLIKRIAKSNFKKHRQSNDVGSYSQPMDTDILITLLIAGILISIILFSK